MCGLSAVLAPGGALEAAGVASLASMHAALAHRGPDGEGFLSVGAALNARAGARMQDAEAARFASAFRWLKIQDLDAAAAQPMADPSGRLWLLFNGEIYNHLALRQELAGSGVAFRTRSDTEVVLAAYRRWGTGCFTRLRGMWALALVDLDARRLVISRDRLGIKPLFYGWDGPRLLLASEARAVACARRDSPRAEPFRVHEFLRGLPPQSAELSFFRDVHPVPAGTCAHMDLGATQPSALAFERYWDLASFREEALEESGFAAKREQLEHLLQESVREHATAAVPVGALLSGGLDTSLLARLLAADAGIRGAPHPKTFSIIYRDPEMSEWPYVQFVLAQGGLQGRNEVLDEDSAWNSLDAVVRAQGRPLLGQDAIAQFHAYRMARAHGAIVVLDGQGADELFAGLPLYEAQLFPHWLRKGQWLRLASELNLRRRRYGFGWRQAWGAYVGLPLRRARMEREGLPRYDWLTGDSAAQGSGRTADFGPGASPLARYLYRHVRHTNLPAVLLSQDHGSMSQGVESRVPYLDHRIVELAFQLPDAFKVWRGLRKRILLETARRHLPSTIVERRDKRMFISKPSWMQLRRRRAKALRDMAASEEIRACSFLDAAGVERFVADFLSGAHDDEAAVWRLCTLQRWLRMFRAAA